MRPPQTNAGVFYKRRKKVVSVESVLRDEPPPEEEILLPLKRVLIETKLEGALATIDFELIYVNPSKESPIECTYEFPLEPETLLS